MCRLKDLWHTGIIVFAFAANIGQAGEVKTFVPGKPWQVTIDLNEFEPLDLLGDKTILGGRTNDGITITIIVEKTKLGTKPDKIRKVYGYKTASKFGKKETIEEIDVNNIAIIAYKWSEKNIPDDLNEPQTEWAKDAMKDKWGYHGYTVKDDIAFDIHLSADMPRHTKEQLLDMIKSFEIEPSTETKELIEVYNEFYKEFDQDIDRSIQTKERLNLALGFARKYPGNPDVWVFIGDHYLTTHNNKQAQTCYLKALQKHRLQPLRFPLSTWTCYDGLGLYYGMSGRYDLSKQYFESAYKLAKDMKEPHYIASSAYNLACLYAETNDVQKSVKYLEEAIKLKPETREEAKKDSSFSGIKDKREFKDLIYN